MTQTNLRNRSFFVRLALILALSVSWLIGPAHPVQAVSTSVVISQVYGGGGNSGATYTHDFIELYNLGATAVDLSGWTVQYASSSGSTWAATNLTGVIQPGKYYLVQEAQGAGGTTALPTPDATGALAMSGTNGKVALVNSTTLLSGACPTGGSIIDFVGFGSATCYEGSAATPALSNTTAALRKSDGAQDTDQNGNDFTVGAPNPRNSAFGGVSDSAPSVQSVTPLDGAWSVAVDANPTVSFSEPVNVTGSWYSIVCTVSGAHTAVVSGGPSDYTLDPDADFNADESCTVTIVAAQVSDVDAEDPPDAMTADYSWTFSTGGNPACSLPSDPIADVQGSGTVSPDISTQVTVQGQVVADFQASTQLKGFYIQSLTPDSDPLTSEGIFIYDNAYLKDVDLNDVVRVTGTVAEYQNQTQVATLTDISVCSSGNAPIAPVTVNLPENVNGDLEAYEGMLIHIPQTLYVNQNYFLGRYGQVTLSVDSDGPGDDYNGLMYWPTNGNFLTATQENNLKRILILDDASSVQNPTTIPYIDPVTLTNRVGDTIDGLTGVLDQGAINSNTSFIDYRLQPTVAPVFTFMGSRTVAPQAFSGNLKVAAFNVLNYFNGDGIGGGFPTSRGASTSAEFVRQRTKIISALQAMDADVVGLMEIENDGTGATSAIQDLVNGLNDAMGAGTYAFVTEPAAGTDAIKVGLIYKPAVVTPVGAAQNFQVNAGGYSPLFDRPPLAQTFSLASNGEKFSVVVNHFKSRNCGSASGDDLDQGDLQGCYNAKRSAQAAGMLDIIDTLSAVDPDVLVMGDLNAYLEEDPLNILATGGVASLTETFVPAADRYTYVFDGWLGELDHALATSSLADQTVGATIWHINAGEPLVIDYNTEFKPQDLYSPTPYRSSDHDPVIVTLQLSAPSDVQVVNQAAVEQNDGVLVSWSTTSETGLVGFNLYRTLVPGGTPVMLNTGYITGSAGDYQFLDETALPGQTYEYTIEIVANDGSTSLPPLTVNTQSNVQVVNQAAVEQNDGVLVSWSTTSETGLVGFNLYRTLVPGGTPVMLNTGYITGSAGDYQFLDETALPGQTYEYTIEIVANDGSTSLPPLTVNTLFKMFLAIINR